MFAENFFAYSWRKKWTDQSIQHETNSPYLEHKECVKNGVENAY